MDRRLRRYRRMRRRVRLPHESARPLLPCPLRARSRSSVPCSPAQWRRLPDCFFQVSVFALPLLPTAGSCVKSPSSLSPNHTKKYCLSGIPILPIHCLFLSLHSICAQCRRFSKVRFKKGGRIGPSEQTSNDGHEPTFTSN